MKKHSLIFTTMSIILIPICTIFIIGVLLQDVFAKDIKIFITSPKDGEKILLSPGELMPAQRPIEGYVEGITKEELTAEQLLVEVSIRTDKWYPQGITRVKNDGSWRLRTAYFGGARHLIKAVLKDMNENVLASTSATATIIQ